MSSTLRTNLYVDGFNLYYGAAKKTRLKWVNVTTLAEAALLGIQITDTRYFTAMVKSDADDPQRAQRQQAYLRALRTLPNLKVIEGRYQYTTPRVRSCDPPPKYVRIHKSEEKGTDVNIATHMLVDAFRGVCDQMVLITNDSDLEEPVRIINVELKIKVFVLNPQTSHTTARGSSQKRQSFHLKGVAHSVSDITSDGNNCHMTQSQLPHIIHDANGTITIPSTWV